MSFTVIFLLCFISFGVNSCDINEYERGQDCALCSDQIQNCIICDAVETCGDPCEFDGGESLVSRLLISQALLVSQQMLQCQQCIYQITCSQCQQYYTLSQEVCVDICGDGHAITNPCDFSIQQNNDGCSDTCQVQPNYSCTVTNFKTECFYTGAFTFAFQQIILEPYENLVHVSYTLSPNLPVLSRTNLLPYFSLNDSSLSIVSSSFDSVNGVVTFGISYTEDMKNKSVTLMFNPSGRMFVSNPGSFSTFQIQNVYYYTPSQYQFSKFVSIFVILLLCLGCMGCLAALPVRRLAGIQIVCTLQYSWISLLWYPNSMPLLVTKMMPLKYSSGYNYISNYDLNFIPQSSPYINFFLMSSNYLWQNFNLNMLAYFVPILMGAIFKIYKQFGKDPQKKQKAKYWYQFSLQLLMYSCVFNLQYLVACSIIYFDQGDLQDPSSYIVFFASFSITIGVLIKFWIDPHPFNRFRYEFKISKVAFKHYYFYIAFLIGCILLMGTVIKHSWIPLLLIVPFTVYIIIFRPYKMLRQNLRMVYFLVIMIYATCMNTYAEYFEFIQLKTNVYFGLYGLEIILLLIGIIWSFLQIILALCDKYGSNKQQEQKLKQQQDRFEHIHNNIYSGNDAKGCISPKFQSDQFAGQEYWLDKKAKKQDQHNSQYNSVENPLKNYLQAVNQSFVHNKSLVKQSQTQRKGQQFQFQENKQIQAGEKLKMLKLMIEQAQHFKLKKSLDSSNQQVNKQFSDNFNLRDQYDAI